MDTCLTYAAEFGRLVPVLRSARSRGSESHLGPGSGSHLRPGRQGGVCGMVAGKRQTAWQRGAEARVHASAAQRQIVRQLARDAFGGVDNVPSADNECGHSHSHSFISPTRQTPKASPARTAARELESGHDHWTTRAASSTGVHESSDRGDRRHDPLHNHPGAFMDTMVTGYRVLITAL